MVRPEQSIAVRRGGFFGQGVLLALLCCVDLSRPGVGMPCSNGPRVRGNGAAAAFQKMIHQGPTTRKRGSRGDCGGHPKDESSRANNPKERIPPRCLFEAMQHAGGGSGRLRNGIGGHRSSSEQAGSPDPQKEPTHDPKERELRSNQSLRNHRRCSRTRPFADRAQLPTEASGAWLWRATRRRRRCTCPSPRQHHARRLPRTSVDARDLGPQRNTTHATASAQVPNSACSPGAGEEATVATCLIAPFGPPPQFERCGMSGDPALSGALGREVSKTNPESGGVSPLPELGRTSVKTAAL